MSDVAQTDRTVTIAKLTDEFRTTFLGGSFFITSGIQELGPEFVASQLLILP